MANTRQIKPIVEKEKDLIIPEPTSLEDAIQKITRYEKRMDIVEIGTKYIAEKFFPNNQKPGTLYFTMKIQANENKKHKKNNNKIQK